VNTAMNFPFQAVGLLAFPFEFRHKAESATVLRGTVHVCTLEFCVETS
jgi:hypothetical protein